MCTSVLLGSFIHALRNNDLYPLPSPSECPWSLVDLARRLRNLRCDQLPTPRRSKGGPTLDHADCVKQIQLDPEGLYKMCISPGAPVDGIVLLHMDEQRRKLRKTKRKRGEDDDDGGGEN